MSNYSFGVRTKRWIRFSINYIKERMRGLEFSMVYVGDIQKNVAEFHGYSMTDEKDMKRMLKAIPVNPSECSFLDVGCGKGICMKCAVESGYGKVAGLDLDKHLLGIAKKNMSILKMDVRLINANAVDFDGYADFDVFYFYNPGIAIVNLKPCKLAGVVSEGMLLCAEDAEGNLSLLTTEKGLPGGSFIS